MNAPGQGRKHKRGRDHVENRHRRSRIRASSNGGPSIQQLIEQGLAQQRQKDAAQAVKCAEIDAVVSGIETCCNPECIRIPLPPHREPSLLTQLYRYEAGLGRSGTTLQARVKHWNWRSTCDALCFLKEDQLVPRDTSVLDYVGGVCDAKGVACLLSTEGRSDVATVANIIHPPFSSNARTMSDSTLEIRSLRHQRSDWNFVDVCAIANGEFCILQHYANINSGFKQGVIYSSLLAREECCVWWTDSHAEKGQVRFDAIAPTTTESSVFLFGSRLLSVLHAEGRHPITRLSLTTDNAVRTAVSCVEGNDSMVVAGLRDGRLLHLDGRIPPPTDIANCVIAQMPFCVDTVLPVPECDGREIVVQDIAGNVHVFDIRRSSQPSRHKTSRRTTPVCALQSQASSNPRIPRRPRRARFVSPRLLLTSRPRPHDQRISDLVLYDLNISRYGEVSERSGCVNVFDLTPRLSELFGAGIGATYDATAVSVVPQQPQALNSDSHYGNVQVVVTAQQRGGSQDRQQRLFHLQSLLQ